MAEANPAPEKIQAAADTTASAESTEEVAPKLVLDEPTGEMVSKK